MLQYAQSESMRGSTNSGQWGGTDGTGGGGGARHFWRQRGRPTGRRDHQRLFSAHLSHTHARSCDIFTFRIFLNNASSLLYLSRLAEAGPFTYIITIMRLLWTTSLLLVSAPTLSLASDVPGCGCSATVCDPALGTGFPDPEACVFVLQPSWPYQFEGITNQSVPLCDALDADPTFQSTFGKNAKPYYWWSGGQQAGPYSPSGFLPIFLFPSTCSEAFEYQDSCGATPVTDGDAAGASLKGKPIEILQQRYESRTNGTDDVTEGDETDGSTWFGAGYSIVDQSSCGMATYTLPNTGNKVRVTPTCASRFDKNITAGYEDSLLLYVESGGGDGFLCDADVAAGYTPALTSEDWIEPISGRRYMCYEFVDEGQAYSVLTMSLGNAPCDGPEPPSPSPSTSSANEKGGGGLGGNFPSIFAVPIVVTLLAALVPI